MKLREENDMCKTCSIDPLCHGKQCIIDATCKKDILSKMIEKSIAKRVKNDNNIISLRLNGGGVCGDY